jgi:hypothetical protein
LVVLKNILLFQHLVEQEHQGMLYRFGLDSFFIH